MTEGKKIRILLVDDHQLFREGVKRILEMEKEFEVVGEGADGQAACELAEALVPDIILMDINMPGMNGVQAAAAIRDRGLSAKMIILSIHDDENYVHQTLLAGASGYLLKEMDTDALIEAVRVVAQGGAYIHPKVTGKLIDQFRRLHQESQGTHETRVIHETNEMCYLTMGEAHEPYLQLTSREKEVLQLMAEGTSNRAIGQELYISEKTVKNHVSSILQKLSVQDRTQAVVISIKNGWVKL